MKYFELINKCLTELSYKQVNNFADLIKNDHKKIKNIMNLINTEVCRSDKWNFLLRKKTLILPKDTCELENTIPGRFASVLIDETPYKYFEDFEKFFTKNQPPYTYSTFNNKLLFPSFGETKNIEIAYYTENNAKDEELQEKISLENADDSSLIPDPYAEPILVYGTCLRHKANPQHVKFSYWLSMYNDALANLRSKEFVCMNATPTVKLLRE